MVLVDELLIEVSVAVTADVFDDELVNGDLTQTVAL